MRSDGTELVTFAIVPEGPAYARSATPPLVVTLPPWPLFGFGSMFVAARSTGVAEAGTPVATAASARVEKGQKASTWLGKRAAIDAMPAKPTMRNCWLKVMGNRGDWCVREYKNSLYTFIYKLFLECFRISRYTKYSRAESRVNRPPAQLWRAFSALYSFHDVS